MSLDETVCRLCFWLFIRNQLNVPQKEVTSNEPTSPVSNKERSSTGAGSDIQSEVQRVRERLQKINNTSVKEEKLGAHAQEHHIAVEKLLFIPSREEVSNRLTCS